MAYDNIKLEKGLYTTGKSFTEALESIDPSENYLGTQLEGLDAYQRQLKRFDIKVSGTGSDTVSKFFSTNDSSALFPEYVSRAIRTGIEANNTVDDIVATTTNIDSLDYRSVESTLSSEDKELSIVGEGAYIPETVIKTKETLTPLIKRGRMLIASYEALKFQKLDLFTVTLRQIGSYIAKCQFIDAVSAICKENLDVISTETESFTYNDLLGLWTEFDPYTLTTLIAGKESVAAILAMDEFRDSYAGLDFHATGRMATPFGAHLINCSLFNGGNEIIALDKNCAVEKVQAGDVHTDFDKLIDRQLERATISTITGFSVIYTDAAKLFRFNQ